VVESEEETRVVGAAYPAAKNPGFLPDYGCAKAGQEKRTTEAEKQLAAAGDREHQRSEQAEQDNRTEHRHSRALLAALMAQELRNLYEELGVTTAAHRQIIADIARDLGMTEQEVLADKKRYAEMTPEQHAKEEQKLRAEMGSEKFDALRAEMKETIASKVAAGMKPEVAADETQRDMVSKINANDKNHKKDTYRLTILATNPEKIKAQSHVGKINNSEINKNTGFSR